MRVTAKISFRLNKTRIKDTKQLTEIVMNYAIMKLKENTALNVRDVDITIDLRK